MNFLKRFWRWLMQDFESHGTDMSVFNIHEPLIHDRYMNIETRIIATVAYDPSEDQMKIMKGEVESYFE